MFSSQFDTNLTPIPWTKYFEESFAAFFALNLLSNISAKFSAFLVVCFLNDKVYLASFQSLV